MLRYLFSDEGHARARANFSTASCARRNWAKFGNNMQPATGKSVTQKKNTGFCVDAFVFGRKKGGKRVNVT